MTKDFTDDTQREFSRWIQATLDDNYYTLDGPELQTKQFHYVFVYGTLKKGFRLHKNISENGGEAIGPATTVGRSYVLYRTMNKYPYPVILHGVIPREMGRITGEVWKVPTKVIFDMDFIENNGEMYDRTEIPVEVLIGKQCKPVKIMAWAYLGNNAFWRDPKFNGSHPPITQCDLLTANKDPSFKYYTFMKKYTNEEAA